jgi:hypothetical protein
MENSYRPIDPAVLGSCFAAMADPSGKTDWPATLLRFWSAEGVAAQRDRVLRRTLVQQGLEW